MVHLANDGDLVAEADEAADVDVQPVDWDGRCHEVVVGERVDVERPRRQLSVLPEEAELVATLRGSAALSGMLRVPGRAAWGWNCWGVSGVSNEMRAAPRQAALFLGSAS